MTSPRRSTRITGRHHYHGAVRPCAADRYSGPRGFSHSDGSLSTTSRRPKQRHWLAAQYRSAGSHVPHRSPSQARATSRPDATWAVSRLPPDLSRACRTSPVLTSSLNISTRHQWFTHVRLLDSHLTRSRRAFSATLNTTALDRSTLRWFAASPYRATTEDHPTSGRTLHLQRSYRVSRSDLLHPILL